MARKAARKGRAVLEGVQLEEATIETCFLDFPNDTEEAVQAGLKKWCDGEGTKPPTWEVLVKSMEYAQIAQQDIDGLKNALQGVLIEVHVCDVVADTMCAWTWFPKSVPCSMYIPT